MAKPTFAKLNLKINSEVKTINIEGQEIEIKQYLPINEKLTLIGNVINQAADDNNFSNPIKLEVFTNLEIIFAYTNISFTDKQKEDLVKLYDLMESNGIFDIVIAQIPTVEYQAIIDGVQSCSDAIYAYRNSVMGILETMNTDYSNLNFDAEAIRSNLANPENLTLLKDILTKLG